MAGTCRLPELESLTCFKFDRPYGGGHHLPMGSETFVPRNDVRMTAGIAGILPLGASCAGATMILAATVVALAACSSTPVSRTGALDSRFAWPCDRLIVEWNVDAAHLQRIVGEAPRVRQIDGAGRLQLRVMHCEPPSLAMRDSEALVFAYVLAPVSGDEAAVGITRDRLRWVVLVAGSRREREFTGAVRGFSNGRHRGGAGFRD